MPSRLRRRTTPENPLAGLTEAQALGLQAVLAERRAATEWSWSFPVLLRDRCWLRLDRIPLRQLQTVLPPDAREEAPELMHYRRLLADGVNPLVAQQLCWRDFGMEDCQRALQDYWNSRDTALHGWTAERYRQLVSSYRERIERGITVVPMLVLARKNSVECHQLLWITENTPVMRHTCA